MKHPGLMCVFWAVLFAVNVFSFAAWMVKAPVLVFIPLAAIIVSALKASFCMTSIWRGRAPAASIPARRPDYAAIARMEREIYGEERNCDPR